MASNDSWRGNGPVRGTTFTKFSQEDVEFMRANDHLTTKEVAQALSVKYGRNITPGGISVLAKNHNITLRKGGKGKSSSIAPHDSFYVTPEFLHKKYKLAPAVESKYNKEDLGPERK